MLKLTTLLFLCAAVAFAQATTQARLEIPIDAYANSSWCERPLQNCSTLPYGQQKYNGVRFLIPGDNQNGGRAWLSSVAAGEANGTVSVTIPVNVTNVTAVYMLMNTEGGSRQVGLLTVTFTGSAGATWTVGLVEGTDIRDYNNAGWENIIACRLPNGLGHVGTINAWRNGLGQRLDEQIFALPASFNGQTLQAITITDSGDNSFQRSFLAALTVQTSNP